MIHKSIIICGSSRAGKTTLAKIARSNSQTHRGLIFEGLFPAYFSRLSYLFKRSQPKLFEEYIHRPRFMDEQKSKTITPVEQLGVNSYNYSKGFIPSLNSSFGNGWVIADLHAELYYKRLLRAIPDLHFCIMIRDPRDCVCAGLYWVDYPSAIENRKTWFYKRLFSWILSAHIAEEIKKKHPFNISIVNFNDMKTNSFNVETLLGLRDGWKDAIPDNSYYSFVGNGKFTTPTPEENIELLTPMERAIIQGLCSDIMNKYDYKAEDLPQVNMVVLKTIRAIIIAISILSPSLARGFIELLFSPAQHIKSQINRLKQFIKDMKNF